MESEPSEEAAKFDLLANQVLQIKNQYFRNQRVFQKDMETIKKDKKIFKTQKKKIKLISAQQLELKRKQEEKRLGEQRNERKAERMQNFMKGLMERQSALEAGKKKRAENDLR